ncbi:5-formyltetrahydrofolate cyclo-ligase [Meridianimarinicoccus roseus]|uniref:5-formyltetrahydrofolate cyclo-ligase n=1 Tax=Meridianimarinicoccus roseus TaxID=2072018 RepID=A0A2V2LI92_9RHOB|nr:5-formyltetrahydrofolate cyclo-ligase [Meridianimarinicoccus roseus]PWR03731.1 5-formyltetrahydrofolate cyclo-ligase [Meridianimarinicoccus roseus]
MTGAGSDDAAARKAQARKAAFARRKGAQATVDPRPAQAALSALLDGHPDATVAGYMAIRSEIDPLPVMARHARVGPVCVPVIDGPGLPLRFRQWTPEAEMIDGPFGARVPRDGPDLVPGILIVPLVAFDAAGFRLGYGGGFYDRTLERLRAAGPVLAVGYAFAAQRVEALPRDATDQPLDAVVTETGLHRFAQGRAVGSGRA